MKGLRIAGSWSGGKDSCLAVHECVEAGATLAGLVSVLDENGERSRSHGLRPEVLRAQARSMQVPMELAHASWQSYEEQFRAALRKLRADRIYDCVFGDIDLEDHRKWEERVCEESGVHAHLPLWQWPRKQVLDRFWGAGFRCHIVAVDKSKLDREVLGAELTRELAQQFEERGVDACGENGEFHTLVVDGPLFRSPVSVSFGDVVERSGYLAIDVHC